MYFAWGGIISGEKLPPCFDSLKQHIKRENYQADVWMRSLECNPDSVGRCWSEIGNDINILSNECSLLPNEVPYLLSCGCSRKYELWTCSCLANSLLCTDGCDTHKCENMPEGLLNQGLDALNDEGIEWWTALYFWSGNLSFIFKVNILKLYLICSYNWILEIWYFTDQNDNSEIKLNNT